MKKYVFFIFIFLGLACAQPANSQNKISTDAFEAKISSLPKPQLVDVRTPQEFAAGHLAGSQNINWNAPDFEQNIEKLDEKRPVLVYCAVGGRSGKAAIRLAQLGFGEVYDLAGGFNAWKAAGKKVE